MSCQPHSHLRTQVGRKCLTTHNALQFKLTWCQFCDGSHVLAGTEVEPPTDTVAGVAPVTAHCRCCTGTWCLYDSPLASVSACFWASPAVASMHCGQMDKGTPKALMRHAKYMQLKQSISHILNCSNLPDNSCHILNCFHFACELW